MKGYLLAAASLAAVVPASAHAVTLVSFEAWASGFTKIYAQYDPVPTVVAVGPTRFSNTIDVTGLKIGQSISFQYGPNANDGVRSGTITRVGFDSYGNMSYAGTNFQFSRTQLAPPAGARETLLTADTFTVRQVIPAPVPEPATWMMMIIGFAAVGYATRRKPVLRFS